MRRLVALVVLVAGCPAKPAGGPSVAAVASVPGVGCPSASGIYVASYVQPPQGEQGHPGWVLPLYDAKVASVAGKPSYAPLDPTAAAALGVPRPPPTVWLLPPNAQMCKATIAGYYAAAIEGTTPNVAYGVELADCPPPQDPADSVAIALASDAPPSECRAYPPRPVAARLGEIDNQNHWSRPTKATPIPPAFAKVIPTKSCTPPGCEMLWSIAEVDLGGGVDKPIAWAGAVNWLKIPTGGSPQAQCTWDAETFSGFFVVGPNGEPQPITEGQDHPLVLAAMLADKTGPRALLAEGTGEYTAYDLAKGAATVGRHLVWLIAPADAYGALDKLGPECAP